MFSNFDINVSQQSQYSEKAPILQLDALEFAHMFSVKLCGHHEEGALRPPKLSNLNEVFDRKKNNVFKNMSKLEKPSGEEEGRTESGGSQETTGLVWSPQLG